MVEMALLLPILLAILTGIIDFGWLARNTLIVANAAREGARAAALGRSTMDVRDRVRYAGEPTLKSDGLGAITNGSIVIEQAPPVGSTLAYTSWPPDSGVEPNQKNSVPPNSYVRVTVTYNHRSITGLFSRTVSIPVMMRREG